MCVYERVRERERERERERWDATGPCGCRKEAGVDTIVGCTSASSMKKGGFLLWVDNSGPSQWIGHMMESIWKEITNCEA